MILHFNFEELTALRSGAEALLEGDAVDASSVLAPSETRACVEALLCVLEGDVSLSSLRELRDLQAAVTAVVDNLRVEMESTVVTTHAAHEGAVAAYFDFAHGFTVAHRIGEMASEMEALIELVTGDPPTHETARTFQFPD